MAGGNGSSWEARRPPTTMMRLRRGRALHDTAIGGHRHARRATFKLCALRAPMYDTKTGSKCRELRLVPGRILTFGRSRSSCDVVFSDARVSRQHCQVYWDDATDQLFLLEGAPAAGILFGSGNVKAPPLRPPPRNMRPSLNGLFVDGKRVAHGGCRVLSPGSEVSLVACTRAAQAVGDPGFGDAVGFFVRVGDPRQLYPSAELDMDISRISLEGEAERALLPLPNSRRKGPLVNCKEEARKFTDDKSSVSFQRMSSYLSTTRVRKKCKRSTAEIMGLLRQHQASLTIPEINKHYRLEEDNISSRGQERDLDTIDLSRQGSPTIPPRSNSAFLGKEILSGGLPRSRVLDGEAATPVLAKLSLTTTNSDDCGGVSNFEKVAKPGGGCLGMWSRNQFHDVGHVMDQACPSVAVEEDRGTLADNLTKPKQKNSSNADAGVLKGKHSGSGFLLNRLNDMEPNPQVPPSQETVSLQELLNPTDDLLGIFAATFSSDILWFLSSHNISPKLPVTVACHDRDRCWSTAEESRASSPFASWPNVNVVYPVFPDSCCFITEKRQGIGCHHPKIFLLPRKNNLRVIVTSANLTRTQWLHVTNSVWWQDFPRKASCILETLFCASGVDEAGLVPKQLRSDFAMHLSSFVASLVADVPSEAHWALDLAEFDFSNAAAYLVTSVPGLYGCPCPPISRSVRDAVKQDLLSAEKSCWRTRKFLAAVNSCVVGVSHRFKASADPRGEQVRAFAAILINSSLQEGDLLTVQLKRITNLTADPNAVSVIVMSDAAQGAMDIPIGKDLLLMTGDSFSSSPRNSLHIGFLPRTVAKWVAPLFDSGLCTFAACVRPSEVMAVANGVSSKVAQLVLYVFEGRIFSLLSAADLSLHHKVALCGLLRSMERPLGLWRLHQILSRFDWVDSAETNFIFGSSSVGTSLDAPFLAAFSVAAGKKAISSQLSEESDSQWGAWTAEHEANTPSIGVVFPSVKRVQAAKGGPSSHHEILCFAESTWERLKTASVLHDAIPFPAERDGIPLHVKVAQRRFQNHPRDIPYGWVYCGSHNFSPAAWGRPHAKSLHPCKCHITALGCTLFISNYEVGLIFVEPPPSKSSRVRQVKSLATEHNLDKTKMDVDLDNKGQGLDKYVLPFCVPAPKYSDVDKPATKRELYRALEQWRGTQSLSKIALREGSLVSEGTVDEGNESQLSLESEANRQLEEEYGKILWSQHDVCCPRQ